jgi:hypothetical protein
VSALPDPSDEEGWLPVSAASRTGPSRPPTGKGGDCWNCGQKNGRNREYCKRCGQRLDSDLAARAAAAHQLVPVKGGRGRRAVAFIWTVLVLAAVVVTGVIMFGGFLPRDPAATPPVTAASSPDASAGAFPLGSPTTSASPAVASGASPTASVAAPGVATPTPTGSLSDGGLVAVITPEPLPTATMRTATPTPRATPTAAPTPTPPPTPVLTPTPAPSPTPAPTSAVTSTSSPGPIRTTASPRAPAPEAFVCKGITFVKDPLNRSWVLSGIYVAERADYDRVTLRLVPVPDGPEAVARVNAETVALGRLAGLDLPAPSAGEVATVIRLSPATDLGRSLQGSPDKTAVKTYTALTAPDGRVNVVMGVDGRGCVSIQAPMWDDPATQDTPFVDVTIDVQH